MPSQTDLERLFYGSKLGLTENQIATRTLSELRAAFVADVEVAKDTDELVVGEGTMSRRLVNSSTISSGSGLFRIGLFTARKSETIRRVTVFSGDTAAAATPTLCRVGIYRLENDGSATLIASIANDTTLFATNQTSYTRALLNSFEKVKNVRYGIGTIVVSGFATPTLVGLATRLVGNNDAHMVNSPPISTAISALTDLPATITAAQLSVGSSVAPYGVFLP